MIRIVNLFKISITELRYIMNPRGVYGVFVNRRNIRKNIVHDTATLVCLFFLTVFASVLVINLGGYDIVTSLTATMANLGNIEPGLGRVGPMSNYGFFPWWIKLWLFFIMLVGRFEVYTAYVLVTRAFWRC